MPEITSFESALADCWMESKELGNFVIENDIGGIVHYERVLSDGNSKISIMKDGKKYYAIFYVTS